MGKKIFGPTDCRCCVLCLGFAALATPTTYLALAIDACTLLVVGDCLAAMTSARTPTYGGKKASTNLRPMGQCGI